MVPTPVSENVLTSFAFTFASGTDTSFDYRAFIFQFDTATAKVQGPALFSTTARNGSQAPSFTGLNVALTSGVTYIALLSTEGAVNNNYANGLLAHNSGNVYGGGGAWNHTSPTSNGASGSGSWGTVAWIPIYPPNGNTDLQFTATFAAPAAVPEPSTLALLMPALLAVRLGRHRLKS